MSGFLGSQEQQVHLKEAELNLIADVSKMTKCAAPAQKSELGPAGSKKFLLLTWVFQPRFISSVSTVIQPFPCVQRFLAAQGERQGT